MAKDITNEKICSLCLNKIGWMDRNFTHIVSDGTLCPKCNMTILQLITQRKRWVSQEEYLAVMQKNYNPRVEYSMPLEKAQALYALRDRVSGSFLNSVGLDEGNVFVVQSVFAMPKNPGIFILRAMKLKNKAVLQGFPLKGEVRKGDRVKISIAGTVREFTALDVVPAGTNPLVKETFYSELSANVHKHRVTADGDGWIIIDTEDVQSIPQSGFAATYQ